MAAAREAARGERREARGSRLRRRARWRWRFSGAPSDRISARTVSNHQHHETQFRACRVPLCSARAAWRSSAPRRSSARRGPINEVLCCHRARNALENHLDESRREISLIFVAIIYVNFHEALRAESAYFCYYWLSKWNLSNSSEALSRLLLFDLMKKSLAH